LIFNPIGEWDRVCVCVCVCECVCVCVRAFVECEEQQYKSIEAMTNTSLTLNH